MFSHILTIHKIASQPHWGQVVSNLTPFVCFRNEPHACRGVTVESGWYSCKPLTKLCFKHSTYTTSIRYSICILQPLEELQRALWSTSYGGPGGSLSRTSRVVRASIHPTTPWIMCVVESIVSVCVCVCPKPCSSSSDCTRICLSFVTESLWRRIERLLQILVIVWNDNGRRSCVRWSSCHLRLFLKIHRLWSFPAAAERLHDIYIATMETQTSSAGWDGSCKYWTWISI